MPTADLDGGELIDQARAVLLLAPAVRDTAADATATLLEQGSRTYDAVVAVTVTRSAGSWLRAWERHADSTTRVSCIDVDGDTRAVAEPDGGYTRAPVEQITDPTDMETLGRTISTELERATAGGERVGLAIHSVTDLLHHADESTVFKFVYTLGEVVRRVDGTVYFHMDPAAHDEEIVNTFVATCDAVVELDNRVKVTRRTDW